MLYVNEKKLYVKAVLSGLIDSILDEIQYL